jgi:hypothetical protein
MDSRFKEKDPGYSRLSTVSAIEKIAAYNARASLDSEEQLVLYLQSWWSRLYNRPLKDPLLLEYSLEELLYEYFDRKEREKAKEEELKKISDKMEDDKEKEVLDWAEQMERKELEEERLKTAKIQTQDIPDPTQDPENINWMEEQIKKAKELYGESFGEDISENFDE